MKYRKIKPSVIKFHAWGERYWTAKLLPYNSSCPWRPVCHKFIDCTEIFSLAYFCWRMLQAFLIIMSSIRNRTKKEIAITLWKIKGWQEKKRVGFCCGAVTFSCAHCKQEYFILFYLNAHSTLNTYILCIHIHLHYFLWSYVFKSWEKKKKKKVCMYCVFVISIAYFSLVVNQAFSSCLISKYSTDLALI